MELFDLIESNSDKNIDIYCDMDGVIAEYQIGNFDYNTIRPIMTTINNLKYLSNKNNISIYILSICKTNNIVNDKIYWINKYMPFINKDSIILLSKEKIHNKESKEIKRDYLENNINTNNLNIMIDDDINIIKEIRNGIHEINIFHVSSIID